MCLLSNWEKRRFSKQSGTFLSIIFLSLMEIALSVSRSYFLFHNFYLRDSFRGRKKGRCDSPLSLPRTPTLYP